MESHNSCEKLVDAEAGLASLETPKSLTFVSITRKRGSLTNSINYFFILFGIGLIALVSYEIWQTVRSEKLIKQIQIQNEEKQNEEFLWRIQEIEPAFDERNTISTTTAMPPTTSIRLEADDTAHTKSLGSIMEIPLDSPSLKIIEEDVIQGSDDYESLVPATVTKSIDETESGRLWIIHFGFGPNSRDNDTTESKDTETMPLIPLIAEDASDEGWNDYIHRMLFNPVAKRFGMSWKWTWGKSSEEDNQSSESAEYVGEKIDSIETEMVNTPVVATINVPRNYDYRYEDYSDEDEEYETVTEVESSHKSDEDLEMSNTIRPGSFAEDVEEVTPSTSTEVPPIFQFPSVYENTDHVSQYDSFGETTEQGAEDESKSTEVTTEYLSKEDHLLIEEYFRNLAEQRIAEVTLLEELYAMIQDAEKYPDYVTGRDYGVDFLHSSQFIPSTKALQDYTLESGLASTVGEDSEKDDFLASTEAPQISESTTDVLHDPFWQALFGLPERDAEDRLKSAGETSEVLSKQDNPLSEYETPSDTTTLSGIFPTKEEPDEYSDYYDDEYAEYDLITPSYISKRSVDAPSALEIPSEPVSVKEFGRKISILQDAIDQDNHLLMNEVSLTSGPTKQALQSKLNKFYAKMEVVSAHIDRLHERYLRLNKLDDDYVSRELPAEEVDTPWTPTN